VYPAPLQLHRTALLQQGKGLGHSLALGADHGSQLQVSVAGGYLGTLTSHDALALDELEDKTCQACWDLFEGYILHPVFSQRQALAQDLHHLQPDLGLVHHEPLEIMLPHLADDDPFHGLRVCVLEALGRQRHLPEDGSCAHDRECKLAPVRSNAVDPNLPLLEHKERLAALLWGVQQLAPLIMGVRYTAA